MVLGRRPVPGCYHGVSEKDLLTIFARQRYGWEPYPSLSVVEAGRSDMRGRKGSYTEAAGAYPEDWTPFRAPEGQHAERCQLYRAGIFLFDDSFPLRTHPQMWYSLTACREEEGLAQLHSQAATTFCDKTAWENSQGHE